MNAFYKEIFLKFNFQKEKYLLSVPSIAVTYEYMLIFWTLSIVLVLKHDVSETGCLRPQVNKIRGGSYSVVPLRKS
jgi:hypothetical protein